jgi:copper transport protein
MVKVVRWVGILITFIVSLLLASPVQAHAILEKSVPEANATLARAPVQVDLYFSEPVDLNFSKIQVLDENGSQVDAGDSHIDPTNNTHLSVSLGSLRDGVYTVTYSVVSAADGHATSGSFPFATGNVNPQTLANAQPSTNTSHISVVEVLVKGWLYLAAAAVTGGILFTFLVWRPSLRLRQISQEDLPGFNDLADKITWVGLVSLLIADILSIMVQAGGPSGAVLAFPWQSDFGLLLFNTRLGVLAISRFSLVFALMGLLLTPANRWNRWAALLCSLLLILSISLTSHAAAESHPFLPVLADWIHLAAVSIWVGGLFYFLAGLWASKKLESQVRLTLTAVLIPHFSNLALVSVGALAATGLYSAVLRLGALPALINTPYGQALAVKLIFALIMIGFGAFNILVTTPAMRRAAASQAVNNGWVPRFVRLVSGEVAIGILVLIWVGLLTSLPPAQTASSPNGLNLATHADDLSISLNIDPGNVGTNTFTVKVSSGGQQINDAQRVTLEFASISGKVPTTSANLTNVGSGVYTLKGGYLGITDQWYIQVVVVRKDKFDAYGSFRVNMVSGNAQSIPWKSIAESLLIISAIIYAISFRALDSGLLHWGPVGFIPALLLVLIGIILLARPTSSVNADPINPVSPDAASISSGKTIFQQNCEACHGVTGKGDGPVGLSLNPRPADLSQHAVPGVHTDGQLFKWITNGFPNSAMPAFKQKLNDTQRWDLVNFIRTLAPEQ